MRSHLWEDAGAKTAFTRLRTSAFPHPVKNVGRVANRALLTVVWYAVTPTPSLKGRIAFVELVSSTTPQAKFSLHAKLATMTVKLAQITRDARSAKQKTLILPVLDVGATRASSMYQSWIQATRALNVTRIVSTAQNLISAQSASVKTLFLLKSDAPVAWVITTFQTYSLLQVV
jgi:hypothetical protein